MTRTISEWVKSLDQLHYCTQIEVVCFYKRGIKTLMNDSRKMHTGAFLHCVVVWGAPGVTDIFIHRFTVSLVQVGKWVKIDTEYVR